MTYSVDAYYRIGSADVTEPNPTLRFPGGGPVYPNLPSHGSIAVALLFPINPKTSFGGGFSLGAANSLRASAQARYRRWIADPVAVDISPGLLYTRVDGDRFSYGAVGRFAGDDWRVGGTLDVGLRFADWAAIMTRFDAIPTNRFGTLAAAYVGARMEGRWALGVTTIAALGIGTLAILLRGS